MEYVIGILLLVSFVGLAVYAVRGGNLMLWYTKVVTFRSDKIE